MKRFNIWLENREDVNQAIYEFLSKFGLKKDALEKQDRIISDYRFEQILDAINVLPTDEDTKIEMKRFAQEHKEEGFKALLNIFKHADIVKQDKKFSKPGTLPQGGQPMPKPQPDQQMQQQPGM